MKTRETTIGGLESIEILDEKKGGPTLVFFHGYGADMRDLAPLSQALRVPPGTRWIFPNAPILLQDGPFPIGRAWFPIDMVAMQEASLAKDFDGLAQLIGPRLEEGRQRVLEFLEALGGNPEDRVLAGFSQGAMLAAEAFLHSSKTPLGLAILSGGLAGDEAQLDRAVKIGPRAVFQSHGRQDPVLPFALAERLREALTRAGWAVDFLAFEGGHELPMDAVARLSTYLDGVFSEI